MGIWESGFFKWGFESRGFLGMDLRVMVFENDGFEVEIFLVRGFEFAGKMRRIFVVDLIVI